MHQKIFVTGLPASGKSTFGKELAGVLGWPFIDLDEVIVQQEGMSVPEVIEMKGEPAFRKIESEALREVGVMKDCFVLATGGGAPCFHFNMDFMNEQGVTLYLDVSPGEIALRMMEDGVEKRPLIRSYDHQDLIEELRTLHEKRSPFYNQSKIKLNGRQVTVEKAVAQLKALTPN